MRQVGGVESGTSRVLDVSASPSPKLAPELSAARVLAECSRRAEPRARRGLAAAAECLGLRVEDLVLIPLSRGPRALAWRCRPTHRLPGDNPSGATPRAGVVLRCFLRRDGAVNSGGFGYLRALHGHRCLPGAPGLLASDDAAGVLVSEDLAAPSPAGKVRTAAASARATDRWLAALPDLCPGAESPAGRAYRAAIAAADPRAEEHGGAGALASWRLMCGPGGLSEGEARTLLDPRSSVLWCGDLNPEHFLELPGQGWAQVDLEGTAYCSAALLVADVEAGLPLSEATPPAAGWAEHARRLAAVWAVDDESLALARTGLARLRRELLTGPRNQTRSR